MIAYQTLKPNETVVLFDGSFELRSEQDARQLTGSVAISWLPKPRLVFTTHDVTLDPSFSKLLFHPPIRVADPRGLFTLEESGGFLLSAEQRAVILEIGLDLVERSASSDLDNVVFHVVNLDGLHERDAQGGVSGIDKLSLGGAGWKAELRHASTDYRVLRDSGGFAITYIGILQREDGGSFASAAAAKVLDGLHYFLSFARSGWCWPCLYIGAKRSEFSWFRCTAPAEIDGTGSARSARQQFPFAASEAAIAASFEGFMNLWSHPELRKPIQTALTWYVEGVRARSMESAMVAGQTALELIAWVYVVEGQKILSPEGFDKLPASDRLKLLLKLQGIPTALPASAGALAAYSSHRSRRWEDGPRAVTELRNSIVHPKRRETLYHAPAGVRDEARRLTSWYLSAALLRLFGYTGEIPES